MVVTIEIPDGDQCGVCPMCEWNSSQGGCYHKCRRFDKMLDSEPEKMGYDEFGIPRIGRHLTGHKCDECLTG